MQKVITTPSGLEAVITVDINAQAMRDPGSDQFHFIKVQGRDVNYYKEYRINTRYEKEIVGTIDTAEKEFVKFYENKGKKTELQKILQGLGFQ